MPTSFRDSHRLASTPFAARLFLAASGLTLALVLACVLAGCGDDPPAHALRILDVSPDGQTENLDTPITVRFDKPAVDAGSVGKALRVSPITLEPAVAVTAHWSDRQTLVLAPKVPFKRSTRYRLAFGDALVAQLGKQPDIGFIAGPLRVTRVLGTTLSEAPPDFTATLVFSAPVIPTDVVEHCFVALALPPQTSVPLKVTGPAAIENQASDSVSVASTTRLQQGQEYVLRCDGVTSTVGNTAMPEPFTERVKVYPTLALLALEPSGGNPAPDELELRITTTTPIDPEELGKNVHLKPSG